MFRTNHQISFAIFNASVTTIHLPRAPYFDRGSFINCSNLENVTYAGEKDEWGLLTIGVNTFANTKVKVIHCSNRDIDF